MEDSLFNNKRIQCVLLLSFVLGLFLSFAAQARANVIYVNGKSGCGEDIAGRNGSDTCNDTFKTIQYAIDRAGTGDVVKVVPYNYDGVDQQTTYYENLVVTKEITLEIATLVDNSSDWAFAGTTLEGSYPAKYLVVNGDADDDKVGDNGNATITWGDGVGGTLRNLTVWGGYSKNDPDGLGAGVLITGEGANVTVEGLWLFYNDNGIAVRYGAAPVIKKCIIFYNDRSGIVVRDGSAPIIGGGGGWDSPGWTSSDRNQLKYNSQGMSDGECPPLGGGDCNQQRPAGCAAIMVSGAASAPKIWGNYLYKNKYAGIRATDQSTPSIKGNKIRKHGTTDGMGVGVCLLSAGMGTEIVGNRIDGNKRGIGIQSSGEPCNKIAIKNNDILNNTREGISTCNAYVQIGGSTGEGNRIYDNGRFGIFLSKYSEGEISYNNINNNWIGIRLLLSGGIIENNLITDNGLFGLGCENSRYEPPLHPLTYAQVQVWGGTVERINNNLIVGGNYSGADSCKPFEGIGILMADQGDIFGDNNNAPWPLVLGEVRDNIIYRVGLGIILQEGHGTGLIADYRPGAVDRNLVMQWGTPKDGYGSIYDLEKDSVKDGYLWTKCVGGGCTAQNIQPGENTYYYGQESGSYGDPASYFFTDPDHESDTTYPDFKLVSDLNSPLYALSNLGLPPDFVYIDSSSNFNYDFQNTLTSDIIPTVDVSAPTVAQVIPVDGASNVSINQAIRVYLQDTGDGIDESTVSLSLSGGAGSCNPCAITTSGNSSYLEVVYDPPVSLDTGIEYTINISADDMQGHSLSASSSFTTNSGEGDLPYVADLSPADGVIDVAVSSAIQFKVRDTGSGVNPDTISLYLNNIEVTNLEKTLLTDGSGTTPDYLVYYQPANNFSYNTLIQLKIYAQDYDGNPLNGAAILEPSFTTGDNLGYICDECNDQGTTGTISPSLDTLWPPNHNMVPITIDVSALVTHNPDTHISISSVVTTEYSNQEAGEIQGESIYDENNFEPDVEITGDLVLNLRSERTGASKGRTYVITVTALDCSGNYTFSTEVTVPHDKR